MHRSRRTRDRRRTPGRPPRRLLERSADERLVELVLAGDETAFEELFERHAPDALWFARETLGSWKAAEEAVRHSFAAAHAYLASRDPNVEFAPWLHTILSNHCLSMLQARAPGPERSGATADVVDLAAWRSRRRKPLGGVVPLPPGAGLHGSFVAACGLGAAGAAATGAPLLGGTLAKVAIVAVLATSVGVAGDVATQRGDKQPEAGVRVVAERGSQPAPAIAPDRAAARVVIDREGLAPREPAVRLPHDLATPHRAGDPAIPAGDRAPGADAPALPAAGGVEAPVAPAAPGTETVATPVRAVLDAAEEMTSADAVTEPSPQPPSPVHAELRRIGDALGVTTAQPPAAVGNLLSRVVSGRPR